MKNEDLKVLQFIYDRLECVHEENVNYDYMLSLKNIIEREREQLSLGTVVQAKPEKFACYEIHTVQARMYGCATQCEECKAEEQALSSFKPKDKDASA
jgi:hypothetical protein